MLGIQEPLELVWGVLMIIYGTAEGVRKRKSGGGLVVRRSRADGRSAGRSEGQVVVPEYSQA